jgi:hypothetical protein
MARNPACLPEGPRLTDFITMGILANVFPVADVRIALAEAGKRSIRERDFPNHLVVYFVIMMTFYMRSSYDAIIEAILLGLEFITGVSSGIKITSKTSIIHGRERIGWEPMANLFDSHVKPIATKETKGAWYRGLRMVAMDGTTFEVADSEDNQVYFPRSAGKSASAFPRLDTVFLVESGTHVVFGLSATTSKEHALSMIKLKKQDGELTLAKKLLPKLKRGMLLLCDRLYPAHDLIQSVLATGAHLLWRIKSNIRLDVEKQLPDGSFLSRLHSGSDRHRKKGVVVRVIDYKLKGVKGSQDNYRIITSLLNHKEAPAHELAALYHERWEIETTNSEVKVHLKPSRSPLRSKSFDMVIQELYGIMLGHYIVRKLMHQAALKADEDPDRISFSHAVQVITTNIPEYGDISPQKTKQRVTKAILRKRVSSSRGRQNPRQVRRWRNDFPTKKAAKDKKITKAKQARRLDFKKNIKIVVP